MHRRLVLAVMTTVATFMTAEATAQQMSFTYYTDAFVSSDRETLYTVIDRYDYSTGCTHWDYANTGYVNGPSGSYQQPFGGLSAYMSVPAFEGNYSFSNSASVS